MVRREAMLRINPAAISRPAVGMPWGSEPTKIHPSGSMHLDPITDRSRLEIWTGHRLVPCQRHGLRDAGWMPAADPGLLDPPVLRPRGV